MFDSFVWFDCCIGTCVGCWLVILVWGVVILVVWSFAAFGLVVLVICLGVL